MISYAGSNLPLAVNEKLKTRWSLDLLGVASGVPNQMLNNFRT